jgi:hypothetical protein
VADLYCNIIKTCLAVPDAWGAAANALEYAGLQFRDHVTESSSNDEDGSDEEGDGEDDYVSYGDDMRCPKLSADSLWAQACYRLLDIDIKPALNQGDDMANSGKTRTNPASGSTLPQKDETASTWDQKFFSQIEMSDAGRYAIQDMMLSVIRVGVRCLLSRDDVDAIAVTVSGKLLLQYCMKTIVILILIPF